LPTCATPVEPRRRVAEFRYQPTRWRRSYRFVVIRRPQLEEPIEQLTLFKIGRYHYQVLVTNLPLQPLNLWRFYNDRAGIELVIRQPKGDYALGRIPVITSWPTKPTSTCCCSPTISLIGSSASVCRQSFNTPLSKPCASRFC
jgi:hypothetical protein